MNKTLPYLVSNVIELLDVDPEELGVEEDGGHVDLDSQRKGEGFDPPYVWGSRDDPCKKKMKVLANVSGGGDAVQEEDNKIVPLTLC